MLRVRTTGCWRDGQVLVRETPTTYHPSADTEAAIERAWTAAKARLGDHLFDGPMCRFEGFEIDAAGGRCVLSFSRTSYRLFLGTNLASATLPGQERANPVGVSTGLVSADGWFLLGRRSGRVAYYPHRLHPFAGSLEPSDRPDLFDEARRELREELSLSAADVGDLALLGIVEDLAISHPETILHARTTLARGEVESRLDRHEHAECWACRDDPRALAEAAVAELGHLTPVALGAMLLHGRDRFGEGWYRRAADAVAPAIAQPDR